MEYSGSHDQYNSCFAEDDSNTLNGFPRQVDCSNDNGDNEFDCVIRRLREPFNPANPDADDQRTAVVKDLYGYLHNQMEELERRQAEIARMYAHVEDREYEDQDFLGGMDYEREEVGRDHLTNDPEVQDEVEDMNEDEGEDEIMEDEGFGQHRTQSKPRRPYTITCALRHTNWFELSFRWENEHFRSVYRLVAALSVGRFMLTSILVYRNKLSGGSSVSWSRTPYSNLGVVSLNVRYTTSSVCSCCDMGLWDHTGVIRCY